MGGETRAAPYTGATAAPSLPVRPAVAEDPASRGRPNADLRSRSLSLALGRRPAPSPRAWPASGDAVARLKAIAVDIWLVPTNSGAEQSAAELRQASIPPGPTYLQGA